MTVQGEPRVRMRHVRQMKGCGDIGNWWRFFDRHGLDRRTFLRLGLPVSQVEATGDAMAIQAAANARAEANDGR